MVVKWVFPLGINPRKFRRDRGGRILPAFQAAATAASWGPKQQGRALEDFIPGTRVVVVKKIHGER